MYDPSFGPTALRRHYYQSDFRKYAALNTKNGRDEQLKLAVNLGKVGFSNLNFQTSDLAGRTIYQLTDFPSELVLRKSFENIHKVSGIKQANRIEICRRIKLLCEEGMPFTLAKFDIQKFYESIQGCHLQDLFIRRLSTLPSTRHVLSTFIRQCESQEFLGLPRGLAISAALSELYINDFDTKIQRKLETHFYARFVDDIVMLLPPTFGSKSLRKNVSSMLPPGLSLNESKTKILYFNDSKFRDYRIEHEFDYLGFCFIVSHIIKNGRRGHYRCVKLDISRSKIKKTKTRIVRALRQYIQDKKFVDLHDRFKVLTCNYKFYDRRKNRVRLAGLYHNYGLIDLPSSALKELDLFIRHILLSKSGELSESLAESLSKAEREELLRLLFTKGFKRKTYFNFSPSRLAHLVKCWKYA